MRAVEGLVFVDFSNAFEACVVSTVREAHRRTQTGPWGAHLPRGGQASEDTGRFPGGEWQCGALTGTRGGWLVSGLWARSVSKFTGRRRGRLLPVKIGVKNT